MEKLRIFMRRKTALRKCRPLVWMAIVLVLTGCPHNEYIVQLQPRGTAIERTLVFFREDGVNEKTRLPNYNDFDADELKAITALYPAHGLTNEGKRYTARGEFTSALPGDVGGAGSYTNLSTSLGEVGFYVERFRGNDDMAALTERRSKVADRLTDLLIGWSRMELGREPGYNKLREFLHVNFRRDLKNFSEYWWAGQLVNGYKTNAAEEFGVRIGQYLFEHGYFTLGELPSLVKDISGGDSKALMRLIQRLVARKMGVPEAASVPASLVFLADDTVMENSLDKYIAGTDFYRAALKKWKAEKKRTPDLKPLQTKDVASDVLDEMVSGLVDFTMFSDGEPDHLTVRLSLPSAPDHSNGRWDDAVKQEVWDSFIEGGGGTNAVHLPVTCYANWIRADEGFQKAHIGKAAVTGDKLLEYCLWRSSLDVQRGGEWDTFLANLQPGGGWWRKLDAFRFSGEPEQVGTNDQQKIPLPSAYPRELIEKAVE